VERIGNPWVVALGSITFIVATMGINIVAKLRLDRAVAAWRLCRDSERRRLGMADRSSTRSLVVHGADAPPDRAGAIAGRRCGGVMAASGKSRSDGLKP
jgi:hypothetical protein